MGTNKQHAARHEQTVRDMEVQLQSWSVRIDDLVAGYHRSGAQLHDPYRLRVDALRARHNAVQLKLRDYSKVPDPTGIWGAFLAGIKDDWKALEDGLKDLSQ